MNGSNKSGATNTVNPAITVPAKTMAIVRLISWADRNPATMPRKIRYADREMVQYSATIQAASSAPQSSLRLLLNQSR